MDELAELQEALQRESAMASSTASDLQEEMRRVQRELQESNKGLEQLERSPSCGAGRALSGFSCASSWFVEI